MNRNTAEYRRANCSTYRHISRDEYIQRAYEFAPSGERAAKKLTLAQVREIRANRNGYTYERLAEIYDVTPNTIYRITKRITWPLV